ncbi:hypothetical protein GOB94_16060 [Granulicella sp. 5B5]|nr:hypothetical protein GOB94_16060 [Granulicella sp. 5B5]
MEESQRQLDELRRQLAALEQRLKSSTSSPPPANNPNVSSSSVQEQAKVASAISDIQEQQSLQEAQIATHEQTKVESESKYPVKVTGLILFNSFVNTGAVDIPSTPTIAIAGSGSTGASVRQTVLGLDAMGPHLFGARSSADLRIDFEGATPSYSVAGYSGPYASTGLLRLRTAHAALTWDTTEAYFSLDRPIISPDAPTSLTAVAEPALAWSGDLWTWNPQLGITQNVHLGQKSTLRLQAALIDTGDAPQTPVVTTTATGVVSPTAAEQSRWPGIEARFALYGSGDSEEADHIGVGGYFSKHDTTSYNFDAWAATLDARFHLAKGFQLSGNAYRGAALGGLGAGGYKDYVTAESGSSGEYYSQALDDVGGWVQVKKIFTPRWEANAAYGIDNVFSQELRRYMTAGTGPYQNLARNSTYTGNVIFRPSAYLLFSVEYRHIDSAPIVGAPAISDIIGLAAGYKF